MKLQGITVRSFIVALGALLRSPRTGSEAPKPGGKYQDASTDALFFSFPETLRGITVRLLTLALDINQPAHQNSNPKERSR